jgi:hypothetical protein
MPSRIAAIQLVALSLIFAFHNRPIVGQQLPTPIEIGEEQTSEAKETKKAEPTKLPPYAPGTTPVHTENDCPIVTIHSYDDHACRIIIYRDKPGSPQPVTVPKDTKVEIIVKNRAASETVTFGQTTDALPPGDFGLAILKVFLPILPGVTGHVNVMNDEGTSPEKSIPNLLAIARRQLNIIADELSCFKAGKVFRASTGEEPEIKGAKPPDPCGAKFANDRQVDELKQQILQDSEILLKLPTAELKEYDVRLAVHLQACAKFTPQSTEANDCLDTALSEQKVTQILDDELAKDQARQTAVIATRAALASLPDAGDFYDLVQPSADRKATVTITAKDVLTPASVEVAKVVISWRSTPFSVSTGILFSTLHNKTFANTPVIVNGVPVLDSGNKTITHVTESDTVPSIVTPMIFLNYEHPFFYRNNGRFGVLLSGGMGANLTAKTADYAAGVSFRYRDMLFTPAVHFGRQNELTNGVTVGQRLGSSPPTLPMAMHFTPKLAFAITYRVPLP